MLKHENAKAFLASSKFAGQLYKSDEPYKIEIDITDAMTDGTEAFVIGGVPEAGSYGNHNFSPPATANYESLKPYIVITEYSKNSRKVKTERPFVFINHAKESEDLIGDRNKPGKDGNPDYCFDTVFSYPDKKLTAFELVINGDIKRRYNTNPPLDIYPLVGFINEGGLLNDSKGAINYLFKKKIPRNSKYVSTAHTFLKKLTGYHINTL